MPSAIALRALALSFLMVAPRLAHAQAVTLKFGFPAPAVSYVNTEGMTPWINDVEKASDGTLKIQLIAGPTLGTFDNIYERTVANVAQISFGTFGAYASVFVRTQVSDLPFLNDDTRRSSVALWRLYAKGLTASDFDQVKLFGLTAWPGAEVQTKAKKVMTLEDMKGLKLRAQGKWQAATVTAFGATPVSVPVDEVYQALDRGVIDGTWSSLVLTGQFRVDEIAHYFLEAPLNGGGGMLIMKKEAFDALPAAAKAAMEKHSGEAMSRALGKSNDGEVVRVRAQLAALAAQGKIDKPYALSPEEFARWKKAAEPVADAWAKAVPNGPAILAAFRAETAALTAQTK